MTNKITEEKLLLNLVFEVSFPVFSIHTHYWYHISYHLSGKLLEAMVPHFYPEEQFQATNKSEQNIFIPAPIILKSKHKIFIISLIIISPLISLNFSKRYFLQSSLWILKKKHENTKAYDVNANNNASQKQPSLDSVYHRYPDRLKLAQCLLVKNKTITNGERQARQQMICKNLFEPYIW